MILADEVGLGKTIEAGLILKELRARGLADRVLIIVPASLVTQWDWELHSKFNIDFAIYDGQKVKELKRRSSTANVWEMNDSIICSLPFAHRDPHATDIVQAGWDLVIFDEAHRVRRRRGSVTKAYTLAENMRFDTFGMLLLTATPIQLEAYELYSLIELVEPGLFPGGERTFESQQGHIAQLNQLMGLLNDFGGLSEAERAFRCAELTRPIARFLEIEGDPEQQATVLADRAVRTIAEERLHDEHPLVEVMVRNRKSAIPEAFATRDASSIRVQMSPFEEDVYEQVTEYVRAGFNRAKETRNMTAGFLMVAFQKMLTSSSHALARSFERRIGRLSRTLSNAGLAEAREERQLVGASSRRKNWSPIRSEWQDAEEISAALDDAFGRMAKDESDRVDAATRMEIEELRSLVSQLDSLDDSKLASLMGFVGETFDSDPSEKVIVFTQFIETQTYLRDALSPAYDVQVFNGTLKPDEKDRAVQRFRGSGQILISTEAGGEGRNFQFAHIVVNYDLPWNPMKIEQRIGRVDRIGQKRRVEVRNLFLSNSTGTSLDERVMTVLEQRINVFEESIGSLDPILGDVEEAIRRVALEVAPDEQDRAFELLGSEIEQRMFQARQMEERLQDFIMDRNSLRLDKARELLGQDHLAGPPDLERFVSDFMTFNGGAVDEHAKGGQVISMPMPLAHRLHWRSNRLRGTFDPEQAREFEEIDFFAIGHPLVDEIMKAAVDESLSSSIGVYEEEADAARWVLEVWYRVDIAGVRPDQQFRVHRATPAGVVSSETVSSLPSLKNEEAAGEVALTTDEIRRALGRSEERLASELRELQDQRVTENEEMYGREVERLERVISYRRQKELHTIQTQQDRIERLEHEGSSEERRILPALRGRIERANERLELIRLEELDERKKIEDRSRLGVTFEPIAAAFVHQRSR
jgi:ERCC4-related helicase